MKRLSALLCLLLALTLALPAWAEDMAVIEWHTPTPIPAYAPGDCVTFGHYDQDNNASNGKEPIEWLVLETDGDTATLISKYGLDAKPYNTDWDDTWETCTLRAWLNDDFLNEAFTPAEQQRLKTMTVPNPDNPTNGTRGGSDTRDRVYLLSIGEAEAYFSSDDERMCAPTDTAIANGAYTNSSCRVDGRATGCWWLRSPGDRTYLAALVNDYGAIHFSGNFLDMPTLVVRPVVVLQLS